MVLYLCKYERSAAGTGVSAGGLDHNAHWDYAWLTLFCRARKHCPANGK